MPVAMETERESPAPTANQEVAVAGTRWGLQFLCEVHDHLGGGGQGWCVGDRGQLLKLLVSRLREELRLLTAHPPKTREVGAVFASSQFTCCVSDSVARAGAVLLLSVWPSPQEGQGIAILL